jgi:hypothetical protein
MRATNEQKYMKQLALLAILTVAALVVATARSSAPPVGPLPKSPVTRITTFTQELFAFALPTGQSGLTWRGAGNTNVRVARPLTEAEVGDAIVFVYLAVKPGTALVSYGLTDGETRKAYRAARYRIVVRPRHS